MKRSNASPQRRLVYISLTFVLAAVLIVFPVLRHFWPETGLSLSSAALAPVTKTDPNQGVWYEIFVRSFADSNGDGIGDLNGITAQLDYLNDGDPATTTDLGVTGIWLMPIMPSPSYHGYDVTDYYAINPDYGTLADYDRLLAEAHKRGIRVIIDLVVNHTSTQHPWFIDSADGLPGPYDDFYRWATPETEGVNLRLNIWGHKVWNPLNDRSYYAIFWDQMPDLNFDQPAVRKAISDVAQFWLKRGTDGFRLDAAMHIYAQGETPDNAQKTANNLQFWQEFSAACDAVNPDTYLIAEVWDTAKVRAEYAPVFDSLFNFDTSEKNILIMAKNGVDLGNQRNGLADKMASLLQQMTAKAPGFIDAPFLSNHDQNRAMGYFADPDPARNLASMKMAASIYLLLPGNPFIYYGEEIGMQGNKPDERIREPMVWGDKALQTHWESSLYNLETVGVAGQTDDPDSLLSHYRRLIALRNSYEALLGGELVALDSPDKAVSAYLRRTDGQTLLVIHHLGFEPLNFDLKSLGVPFGELIFCSSQWPEGSKISAQSTVVTLPPQTTLVLK